MGIDKLATPQSRLQINLGEAVLNCLESPLRLQDFALKVALLLNRRDSVRFA